MRATPRDYRQLLTTLSRLDQPPLEVVISVIIAQVTLNDSTAFGIDWKHIWDSATTGRASSGPVWGSECGLTSTDGTRWAWSPTSKHGDLTAVLNTLAGTNKVDVLSRPTILVKNNQEASIKGRLPAAGDHGQKSTTDAIPTVANDVSIAIQV